MNILTLYYICYVVLDVYVLDSVKEPSYNLSKNLLLLPRILKLMKDMVDDSTPLYRLYQGAGWGRGIFSIWFKLFFGIMTPINFIPAFRHGISIISNYIWVCLILSFLTFSCMYENIKKYIIRVSSM